MTKSLIPIRVFFLSSFSCNFNDKSSPNFHRFVIVCIHQVIILLVDNYQTCTVPSNNEGMFDGSKERVKKGKGYLSYSVIVYLGADVSCFSRGTSSFYFLS